MTFVCGWCKRQLEADEKYIDDPMGRLHPTCSKKWEELKENYAVTPEMREKSRDLMREKAHRAKLRRNVGRRLKPRFRRR